MSTSIKTQNNREVEPIKHSEASEMKIYAMNFVQDGISNAIAISNIYSTLN